MMEMKLFNKIAIALLLIYFPIFETFEENVVTGIEPFIDKEIKECSQLHLIINKQNSLQNYKKQETNLVKIKRMENLVKSPKIIFEIKDSIKIKSAFRRELLRHSRNCIISTLVVHDADQKTLENLQRIILPTLKPIIYKDQEKVLLTFTTIKLLHTVFKSSFGRKLKHKVGFVLQEEDGKMSAFTSCEYCNNKMIFPINPQIKNLDWSWNWPDYQNNMKGAVLKFSTPTSSKPRLNYTFTEGKYQPANGLLNFCIRYFQKSLNFTLFLQPASRGGGTGIKLPNGSWTGVMSEILNAKADVGMCTAETYSRTLVAGFSSALVYEPVTFVSGPPQRILIWYAFLWPFTTTVWGILIISSVASTLFISYCYKLLQVPDNKKWKLGRIIEYVTGTLLTQCGSIPSELPLVVNIFITIWLLCGFVLTTAYLSKLVGFLTFPVVHTVPQTAEQLAASNFEYGLTFMGGAAYSLIKATKTQAYTKILSKMELTTDHIKCLQRTLEDGKNWICISYETIPKFYINNQLHIKPGQSPLIVSQNYFLSLPVGTSMEKRAVFAPNLEKAVQRFTVAGLIPVWEREDFRNLRQQQIRKKSKRKNVPEIDQSDDLTLKHLHGAFIVFTAGIIIAFFAFMGEQFITKHVLWNKQRQKAIKSLRRNQLTSFHSKVLVDNKLMLVREATGYRDFEKGPSALGF